MSTYPNAHANVLMWIFHFWFPGNWFGFGIILNDFERSTIFQVSFPGVKIAKNPGIQPMDAQLAAQAHLFEYQQRHRSRI